MAWKKQKDPLTPAEPAFHHPDRCMNCGHLKSEHDQDVGCLIEGGTKYMKNEETGEEGRFCNCHEFVPAPAETKEAVTV